MSIDLGHLEECFRQKFHQPPRWGARAPGRVNLIGEHIDYNGGFVLPAAINREVAMLASPSPDHEFHLYSVNYSEGFRFSSGDLNLSQRSQSGWPNYVLAVLDQLHKRGIRILPLQVIIEGDVPSAAGLSSSAAVEVCAATLFLACIEHELPGEQLALLAQSAEHSPWVGVQCGIMDQFISVHGLEGHALKIDCRDLSYSPVQVDPRLVSMVMIHSTVGRELMKSAYNQRRSECEQALTLLNQSSGLSRNHLVQYSPEEFEIYRQNLPGLLSRRARHVITEQTRVVEFEQVMNRGDFQAAGQLLQASHASLRDDYEVSCPELDCIYEISLNIDGVYGCRMTGAGFGGCAVALADPEQAETVADRIAGEFEKIRKMRPWTLVTPACRGACHWKIDSNSP